MLEIMSFKLFHDIQKKSSSTYFLLILFKISNSRLPRDLIG